MQDVIILLVSVTAASLLFHPRVTRAKTWRATIMPLASIIGSGFLVPGPIPDTAYGSYAPAGHVRRGLFVRVRGQVQYRGH